MKPYIGKTVHFLTLDKQHHAAKIVYVSESDRCNLVIWNEFGGTYFHEEALFDPTAKESGTFHFIEEEAQTAPDAKAAGVEDASTAPGSARTGADVREPDKATVN